MSKRSRSPSVAASSVPAAAAASNSSSSSSISAPASSADTSKRPRHFHAGPSSHQEQKQDDDEEKLTRVPPPSPIGRLHRHALESILGFCAEDGLSRALQVSKEWNAAVRSMKSIGFCFDLNCSGRDLGSLLNSPLVRHLGVLFSDFNDEDKPPQAITPAVMSQLTQRALDLEDLTCVCALSPASASFSFPRKLQRVDLTLNSRSTEQLHSLFAALNQLPLLEEVTLRLSDVPDSLNFALLRPDALRSLTVQRVDDGQLSLTDGQLDSFRTPFFANLDCLSLTELAFDRFLHLLRTPHALRWKDIALFRHFVNTPRNCDALASLARTLESLWIKPIGGIDVLPRLVCLTCLTICARDQDTHAWLLSANQILAAFQCPLLTTLTLTAPFTATDMLALLPRFPLLKGLDLDDMSELDSLSFLSKCTGVQSNLTSLCISGCRHRDLHSKQLFHVFSLKALTALDLWNSFVEPLDSFSQALFTPPSRALPLIQRFSYYHPRIRRTEQAEDENEDGEGQEEEDNDSENY